MNHHIVFENYDSWNISNSLRKTHKMVYLLKNKNILNKFLQCIPRTFIITTRNGSNKFNIDMLKDTSTVISLFTANNPLMYQYYLDIEDKENVLKKIEQIYQGELVSFKKNEIQILNQIIDLLNIQNIQKPPINLNKDTYNIVISFKSFKKYIKKTAPQSFIISTNKKDYKCNVFGIHSSKVLSQFVEQNPLNNRFVFDFSDDCNEFQSICDVFNFNKVKITVNIMDSLKEISKILQITDILDDINDYINEHNEILQVIDSEKEIIDSIEKLFNFLYHISDKSAKDVQSFIVNSKWSETEENVQELAAFILQVIKTNSSLHQNILDLLKQLNEEANESNKLSILVPFLIDKLWSLYDESQSICSFIYKSYKYGLITKENILYHLQNMIIINDDDDNVKEFFILNWFLPEIIELGNLDENDILNFCDEKQLDFLLSYLPDDIEKYKIMRDLNEPDNKLTNAIRHDDVDLLKSIIVENNIDITKAHISYNIFEDFVRNGRTNFIDYSAAYGSIKCFKYLFLNHEIIDPITFEYSVFGSNLEMIKIANQNAVGTDNSRYKSKVKKMFDEYYQNDKFNLIIPAIKKHQNDLFDWILEQKYTSKGIIGNFLHELAIESVENGNVHSLIELIDKGYHFFDELSQNWSYGSYTYQDIIETAAKNGFTSIVQLILSFIKRLTKFKIHNSKSLVSFGNKAIIKSVIKYMNSKDIESIFIYFIKQNDLSLIKWIIDNFKNSIKLTKKFYTAALSSSIEIWEFFIQKKISIDFSYFVNNQSELAFANSKVFDLIIKYFPLGIKENIFINVIYSAIKINNKDLVKHLLNQNFEFEDDKYLLFYAVDTKDIEMVDIILKYNSQPDYINRITKNGTALHFAVKTENPLIVQHLLFVPGINTSLYDANNETPLILAARQLNVEIIELFIDSFYDKISQNEMNMAINAILNIPSRYQSLINQEKNKIILKISTLKNIDPNIIYGNTSLLLFACENNNIEIINNLFKFDTIDPNVYLPKNGDTPLIIAIQNLNLEIAKLIMNHPRTNLNMKNYDDNDALYFAVKNELFEIIDSILINENYRPKTNDISSLFYFSSKNTLPHIIKSKYVDVNLIFSTERNSYCNFETKLYIESYYNNYDSVNAIIHHPSFNPEKSNLSKALYIAYKKKNEEICEILVDIADTLTNYKENDVSLFDLAIKDPNAMIKILKNSSFDSKEVKFLDNFIKIIIHSSNNDRVTIDMMNILYEYDQEHKHLINLNQLLPNGKSYLTVINNQKSNIDEFFKFFIDHGINPNIIDWNGFSPFEYAISLNNEKIIDLLIDTNKIDYSNAAYNKMNYLNIFELAVNELDLNMITKIIQNPSFDSKAVDILNIFIRMVSTKKLSLHFNAISTYDKMNVLYEYDQEHEHLINLNQLLPNGKSYFTSISKDILCMNQAVKFFIDHGIDPNIIDSNGISPIEHAILLENNEFITLLIDTNKIDYSKPTSTTGFINIFDLAINKLNAKLITKILQNSSFESQSVDFLNVFIKILTTKNLSHQFDLNSTYDIMNVLYEYDQEHEHLINLNQLLPNSKSYFTSISKDILCINQAVKFFIDHGIDPNIIDSNGISPIEHAILLENNEFITLLIDTNKIDYSKPTSTNDFINIFDLAINKLNAKLITKILQNVDSKNVDFLNVFTKIFTSINSNHLSSNSIYDTVVVLYVYDLNHEHLIDLNQLLPNGKSYFTAISHYMHIFNFFKFFIDHGVDPNIIDSEGICPFEHAILLDDKKTINLLIDTNKIDYSKTISTMKFKRKNTEKNMNLFNIIINNCKKDVIIKVLKNPSFDSKKVDLLKCFIDLNKTQIDLMNVLYQYDQEHEHLIDLNKLPPDILSCMTEDPHQIQMNSMQKKFSSNQIKSGQQQKPAWGVSMKNEQKKSTLYLSNQASSSRQQKSSWGTSMKNEQQKSSFYSTNQANSSQQQKPLWGNSMKDEHKKSSLDSSPNQSNLNKQQNSSFDSSNQANSDQQQKPLWGKFMKNEQQKSSFESSNQANSSQQQKPLWGNSMKDEQKKSSLDSSSNQANLNKQQKSSFDSSNQANSGQQQKHLWGNSMKDEHKKSSQGSSSNQSNSSRQQKPLWGNSMKK